MTVKTAENLHGAISELEHLRAAIAPFATIGGLLNLIRKEIISDDCPAKHLRLDGLEVHHFREAHRAYQRTSEEEDK